MNQLIKQTLFTILFLISSTLYAQTENETPNKKLPDWQVAFLEDVGNAQVVFLGEPQHREGNVFEQKRVLAQLLHQKKGFDIIAFESGFYDLGMQVFKDSLSKEAYRDFLAKTIFPIWTSTEEFQSTLDWLTERQDHLKVLGFDSQFSSDCYEDFNSLLRDNIGEVEGIDWDAFHEITRAISNLTFPKQYSYKDFEKQLTFLDKILRIKQKIEAKTPQDQSKISFLRQALKSIAMISKDYATNQVYTISKQEWTASDSNIRDAQMADNLAYILEENPKAKIICWGAAPHFALGFEDIENKELKDYQPMGLHIQKILGRENVKSYTFVSKKGHHKFWFEEDSIRVPSPIKGSFEASISDTLSAPQFTALTSKPWNDSIFTSYAIEHTPISGKWATTFDGFISLDKFTPTHPTIRQHLIEKLEFTEEDTSTHFNITVNKQQTNESFRIQKISGNNIWTANIIDKETGQNIPYALVRTNVGTNGAICDENGKFQLVIDSADSLYISSTGYESLTIACKDLDKTQIALAPSILELGLVEVSAKEITPQYALRQVMRNARKNHHLKDPLIPYYARNLGFDTDSCILDIEYVGERKIRYHGQDRCNILQKRTNVFYDQKWDQKGTEIGYTLSRSNFFLFGYIDLYEDFIYAPKPSILKKYNISWAKENANSVHYIIELSLKEQYHKSNFDIGEYTFTISMEDFALLQSQRAFELENKKAEKRLSHSNFITTFKKGREGKFILDEAFQYFYDLTYTDQIGKTHSLNWQIYYKALPKLELKKKKKEQGDTTTFKSVKEDSAFWNTFNLEKLKLIQ